ncbi:MAG TPA: hypothetical protein VM100_03775, partial [Longimicrobiales bacterium]|nr:hypothetical protein [Longimicrobiales bacterium]
MKRLALLLLLVPVVPVVLALSATDGNAQGVLLFRNARVFDGSAVLTATDVLVRDGVIARIGKGIAAPAGATVVEARGKTLLPGLIDSHTHAFGTAL